MSFLGKKGKRLFLLLMLLTSLNLGCSHSISGGPFPVIGKPLPPLAVTDPRNTWMTQNGNSYALGPSQMIREPIWAGDSRIILCFEGGQYYMYRVEKLPFQFFVHGSGWQEYVTKTSGK
jgi:hypothetical protein